MPGSSGVNQSSGASTRDYNDLYSGFERINRCSPPFINKLRYWGGTVKKDTRSSGALWLKREI